MVQALTMPSSAEIPRLFIVAERPLQRIALAEIIQACGYEIIENIPPDRLQSHHLLTGPTLWLIDVSNEEAVMEQIGYDAPVMLGIDPAPQPGDRQAYGRWMRILSRKLVKLLGHPPPVLTTTVEDQIDEEIDEQQAELSSWQYVCLLAASMGGPNAVKAFLDAVPTDLPVTYMLVQHIDPHMQELLPRILVRHNGLACHLVLEEPDQLRTGEVLILPAIRMVEMEKQGEIIPVAMRWPGQYQPSINEAMLRAAEAFGRRLITIVFSGMGDDGSQSSQHVRMLGGQIWAQTADSCDCASQPDSMRATGRVQFNGTPEQLAQHLADFVRSEMQQGV
jgi:chemosensory pili system protein ChpB (putative protein-glutamate methylesterase)